MILRAVLLLALATPAWAQQPVVTGKLTTIDGTHVLYLWGTPRERGFAEGYLLGEVIAANLEEFVLSKLVVRPAMWDRVVVPGAKARFRYAERERQWAQGVLEGVKRKRGGKVYIPPLKREVTVDDILVCTCIPDLVGLRCSSFAAWGDRVAKGAIVGRNLDYFGTPTMTRSSLIKVHAADGDRAAWISVGWAGLRGCLTGLSERGIWVAIHDVFVRSGKAAKATSRITAFEELITTLSPSDDVATKARDLLRKHRYAMGGNAMFAWHGERSTGAAVLELDGRHEKDEGVSLRLPGKGARRITCSNHHRMRGQTGHGCWRYGALSKGVAKSRALDVKGAWAITTSASVEMTIYRCVADLGHGRLEVDRRLAPRKDVWAKRLSVDTAKLFAEVARHAGGKATEE